MRPIDILAFLSLACAALAAPANIRVKSNLSKPETRWKQIEVHANGKPSFSWRKHIVLGNPVKAGKEPSPFQSVLLEAIAKRAVKTALVHGYEVKILLSREDIENIRAAAEEAGYPDALKDTNYFVSSEWEGELPMQKEFDELIRRKTPERTPLEWVAAMMPEDRDFELVYWRNSEDGLKELIIFTKVKEIASDPAVDDPIKQEPVFEQIGRRKFGNPKASIVNIDGVEHDLNKGSTSQPRNLVGVV